MSQFDDLGTGTAAEPNNAATWGFVLSLVALLCGCMAPVSLIVSAKGMKREPNKGLALAGLIISLVALLVFVPMTGILVAIAVPGFLKARETAMRNACQENMVRIDGTIQQFILDEDFYNRDAAVGWLENNGGISVLVGEDMYLRVTPVCPLGGTYELQYGSGPPVDCTAPGHDYPMDDGHGTY
ncbi:MAG: hypothetical protein PWP23_981 [Candidatus Sumerlaeota bacterium]|nr:hypothetical protein [Candidatus Sumerlaeota bacterium]